MARSPLQAVKHFFQNLSLRTSPWPESSQLPRSPPAARTCPPRENSRYYPMPAMRGPVLILCGLGSWLWLRTNGGFGRNVRRHPRSLSQVLPLRPRPGVPVAVLDRGYGSREGLHHLQDSLSDTPSLLTGKSSCWRESDKRPLGRGVMSAVFWFSVIRRAKRGWRLHSGDGETAADGAGEETKGCLNQVAGARGFPKDSCDGIV